MATTSFRKKGETVIETTDVAPDTRPVGTPAPGSWAVAPPSPSSAVVPHTGPAAHADDVQGDVDFSDIRLPRLNLVQRTGDLPDRFGFGEFVLNKEVSLGKQLRFVALNLKKQFQEKVEYGSGSTSAVFNTREEVKAAGGSFGFADGQFSELAHIHMLVEMPEGLASNPDAASVVDLFIYEIDGKLFAPVVFSVGRSAYTALAKPLLTSRQFQLRDGMWKGMWELNSQINKSGKGSWATPAPRFLGKLSEASAETTGYIRKGEI